MILDIFSSEKAIKHHHDNAQTTENSPFVLMSLDSGIEMYYLCKLFILSERGSIDQTNQWENIKKIVYNNKNLYVQKFLNP